MWANKNNGFTIVETLIVLAVSSMLFISTVLLIQGQIEKYRTRDAIVNTETKVRDVLNDVATGYFPGAELTSAGKNTARVLAGKSIQFKSDGLLVTTYSAVSDDNIDAISDLTSTGSSELKPYIWQIKPTLVDTDKIYYVLFSNVLGTSGNFVGGALGVKIYDSSFNPIKNQKIYFCNGDKKSSLTLAEDGALTVKSTVNDGAGC